MSGFLWTGKDTDMKEPNGNRIFWSRGNGWVLGGLALILQDMPKNYKHRAFYETLFKDMAAPREGPATGRWPLAHQPARARSLSARRSEWQRVLYLCPGLGY